MEGRDVPMKESVLEVLRLNLVSEILIIDHKHEGVPKTFDIGLVNRFPVKLPMIVFGGLSTDQDLQAIIRHPNVAAVAIGNALNYAEHSVQRIKNLMGEQPIRKARYSLGIH